MVKFLLEIWGERKMIVESLKNFLIRVSSQILVLVIYDNTAKKILSSIIPAKFV